MEKNIVAESVCSDGIVDVVIFICIPVFCQFLRTKYKDGFISVFVIFHDCKRGERLTKTNTVCRMQPLYFSSLLIMARAASF